MTKNITFSKPEEHLQRQKEDYSYFEIKSIKINKAKPYEAAERMIEQIGLEKETKKINFSRNEKVFSKKPKHKFQIDNEFINELKEEEKQKEIEKEEKKKRREKKKDKKQKNSKKNTSRKSSTIPRPEKKEEKKEEPLNDDEEYEEIEEEIEVEEEVEETD